MKVVYIFVILATLIVSAPAATAALRDTLASSPEKVTPLLAGMQAPNSTLTTPEGDPVSLHALTSQAPAVVLFYRGGWCPYCNRQLAELKNIEEQLLELGYQILAISPQSTDSLNEQALKTEFAAQLFTDTSLASLREFGIGFYLDAQTQERYKQHGIALTLDDNGKAVLPAPAVFILDTGAKIQFSYVNPDYKARPSANMILAVARAIAEDNQ
ncbi:peroxiredoxin-like family protein [Alteromonas halophila]|uniref:thioredoxin-dependent peroxiredoxin n=1 Tax=Alteromonas halophila TaxID=516698 RepID=A0A918JL89_9ALTE|nr:peroxiredoxin-like family protein [Alteromonas halophila]GGW84557.1 alkyl hydroperoxide reductase [Alteromonas halophila]